MDLTENGAPETLQLQETGEEIIDINLSDPEVAKAATKIQASFRAREKTKQIKEETTKEKPPDDNENKKISDEEIDINLDDPEVQQAAVKLQARFRGFQARKSLKGDERIALGKKLYQ